tara:strand:- start:99 stop:455 length:357 start_codon:yes stop_codon:yes gene_type:complete
MAKKRARNEKGQLIGDDPSTPDINEAWVEDDAPKKRAAASKKAKQKKAPKAEEKAFTMFVSSSPENSVYDLRVGDVKINGIWDGNREHVSWMIPSHLTDIMMKHHFVWSGRVINAEED